MSVLRTKSVERTIHDTEHGEHRLKRELSALDLTVLGVGVIIGTGIFVLTGEVAKTVTGPAVALSFVVAGVVCALAALCYAEFASTVPASGSAAGIKVSSRVNAVIVTVKVAVVLLVIVAGLFFLEAANFSPFIPESQTTKGEEGLARPVVQALFGLTPTTFGVLGIFTGAAIVFFAFIGFDIVATAAEETRHPQRDMPRGILGSLAVCTALYVAVSLPVVGMQEYTELDTAAPLAEAFKAVGQPALATIITVGALAGLTTVVMILMLGQSRVLFAMSRDGLLPRQLAAVHPTFGTPYRITIAVGVVVALMAGCIPLAELAELVNIGTLFAFVVAVGVMVLRRTRPDLERAFRTPLVPFVPIAAILACVWLMLNLPLETWLRFAVWMGLGFLLYGRRRSRLGTDGGEEAAVDLRQPSAGASRSG